MERALQYPRDYGNPSSAETPSRLTAASTVRTRGFGDIRPETEKECLLHLQYHGEVMANPEAAAVMAPVMERAMPLPGDAAKGIKFPRYRIDVQMHMHIEVTLKQLNRIIMRRDSVIFYIEIRDYNLKTVLKSDTIQKLPRSVLFLRRTKRGSFALFIRGQNWRMN